MAIGYALTSFLLLIDKFEIAAEMVSVGTSKPCL